MFPFKIVIYNAIGVWIRSSLLYILLLILCLFRLENVRNFPFKCGDTENLNCWKKDEWSQNLLHLFNILLSAHTFCVLYCVKFTGFTIVILFSSYTVLSVHKKHYIVTSSKSLTLRKIYFRSQKIYTSILFSPNYFYRKAFHIFKIKFSKNFFHRNRDNKNRLRKMEWLVLFR